jgi:hypothetical protein
MISFGKLDIVVVWSVALNHLQMYSQFFSRICTGTGLKPIIDLAVLEITEDAPPLENALPGIPVLPDSLSEVASYIIMIGFPGSNSNDISS